MATQIVQTTITFNLDGSVVIPLPLNGVVLGEATFTNNVALDTFLRYNKAQMGAILSHDTAELTFVTGSTLRRS